MRLSAVLILAAILDLVLVFRRKCLLVLVSFGIVLVIGNLKVLVQF